MPKLDPVPGRTVGRNGPKFDPTVGRELWVQEFPAYCERLGGQPRVGWAAKGTPARQSDPRDVLKADLALDHIQFCDLPDGHMLRFWNSGSHNTEFDVKVFPRDGGIISLGHFEGFGMWGNDLQLDKPRKMPNIPVDPTLPPAWGKLGKAMDEHAERVARENRPILRASEYTHCPSFTKEQPRCTYEFRGGIVPTELRRGESPGGLYVYRNMAYEQLDEKGRPGVSSSGVSPPEVGIVLRGPSAP